MVLAIAAAYGLYRLVDVIEYYLNRLVGKTDTKLDDMLVAIVRKALRITIAIIAILLISENILGADKVKSLLLSAGIGGIAATKVGEKLQKVAQGLQVLCVTHLPQVAAYADCHYRVEKHQQSDRTRTDLVALDDEERVREMARMLGGAQITDRTMEHARELIAQSVGPAR